MHRHTYLRATDTWAMEMLRSIYLEKRSMKLFPIWIDSPYFWDELKRYCLVRDVRSTGWLPTLVDELIANQGRLKRKVWIQLNPGEADQINHKKSVENLVNLTILQTVIRTSQQVDELLIPIFEEIFNGVSVKQIKNPVPNLLSLLDEIFPKIKQEHLREEDERRAALALPTNLAQCSDAWFKKMFSALKAAQTVLPIQVKSPQTLKDFSCTNEKEFTELLNTAYSEHKPRLLTLGSYVQSVQGWIYKNVHPLISEFSKQSVYYFSDQFMEVDSIVLWVI